MSERYGLRLVGRVVQNLDLQPIPGVLHRAHGFNQAVDDELLVEDGQLHRHHGQLVELPGRAGIVILLVFEVPVAQRVAVHAVKGQHDHHREVGKQHRGVEKIPVVEAGEGLIGLLLEVVAQRVRGEEVNDSGRPQGQPSQQACCGIQTE